MRDGVFKSHKSLNHPRFARSFDRSLVRSLTCCAVALPCDPTNFVIVLSEERVGVLEHVLENINVETTSIETISSDGDTLRRPNSDILLEGRRAFESAIEVRDEGGVPAAPSAKL